MYQKNAATSKRKSDMYQDILVYVSLVSLQISVENCSTNPQKYASMTMTVLHKRDPDAQFLTVDGIPVSEDSTIPKGKEVFDCFFQTEVKRSNFKNSAILIFLQL